jgi:flagellar basal body-associated protein FliL
MAEAQVNAGKTFPNTTNGIPGARVPGKRAGRYWIYGAIAALAVTAGIFYWIDSGGGERAGGGAASESALPLETFVVNLDSGTQRGYLRIGITLGMAHALPRNQQDAAIAGVRDAILSVLASAKVEQLLTAEGKEQLKADLLRAISARAPQLGVENVYFTEFLVQM